MAIRLSAYEFSYINEQPLNDSRLRGANHLAIDIPNNLTYISAYYNTRGDILALDFTGSALLASIPAAPCQGEHCYPLWNICSPPFFSTGFTSQPSNVLAAYCQEGDPNTFHISTFQYGTTEQTWRTHDLHSEVLPRDALKSLAAFSPDGRYYCWLTPQDLQCWDTSTSSPPSILPLESLQIVNFEDGTYESMSLNIEYLESLGKYQIYPPIVTARLKDSTMTAQELPEAKYALLFQLQQGQLDLEKVIPLPAADMAESPLDQPIRYHHDLLFIPDINDKRVWVFDPHQNSILLTVFSDIETEPYQIRKHGDLAYILTRQEGIIWPIHLPTLTKFAKPLMVANSAETQANRLISDLVVLDDPEAPLSYLHFLSYDSSMGNGESFLSTWQMYSRCDE
jgi:hypothetical protein